MRVREGFEGQEPFVAIREYAEVTLHKVKYSRNSRLSKYVIESMHIEKKGFMDGIVSGMVLELTLQVLAEKTIDRQVPVSFNSPTTWWDMFKISFFSEWLLGMFPPKYTLTSTVINFQEYATYPQLHKYLDPEELGPQKLSFSVQGERNIFFPRIP